MIEFFLVLLGFLGAILASLEVERRAR